MNPEVALMLQVAMMNAASPAHPAAGYRRAAIVLGLVIAAHLVLLVIALNARDRMVERPVEPRTITAQLLSPEPPAPVAAPVAPPPPAAATAPPVTRPAVRIKPAPQPRVQTPRTVDKPVPAPAPAHESPAPPVTQPAAPSTEPRAEPRAEPQAAAPSAASAPAAHPVTPASTEPRNVSHVDCSIPKPDYPDVAKRRGEHGTAVVHFVVGLNGRIETAQLQSSSGSTRLDDAALAAVHAGSCQPYTDNGTPVRAAYSQSFVFGLSE
jgi:protein TonB